MAKIPEGTVCPNHPDEPAVDRCLACHKPVCETCLKTVDGDAFCSDKCAENHQRTNAAIEGQAARDAAARRKRLITRLILLVILVLLAGGFIWYFRQNPDKMQDLKDRANDAAEQVGEAAGEASDGLRR